jgi:hypothetical protein
MKLKLNISTNKTLRNKNNKDIFSRIFYNNKNNNIKNINRQNLSGDNFPLNKNNNENINLLNLNNYSILEYNNINKEKNKKKEQFIPLLFYVVEIYQKKMIINIQMLFII